MAVEGLGVKLKLEISLLFTRKIGYNALGIGSRAKFGLEADPSLKRGVGIFLCLYLSSR